MKHIIKKHDRENCSKNSFRGENLCKGYLLYDGINSKNNIILCPCICHEGVTKEQTLKIAKKNGDY